MLVLLCHGLMSGFLANDHLPRVSCQSHQSANDKANNEMKLEAGHRSPGIEFTAEENIGKPRLGACLIKALRPVIASTELTHIKMTSVGLQNTSGWESEGRE